MSAYVSLKEAVKATGLHPHTLRKYADRGDIPSYRIPNGDRRFDVSSFGQKPAAVLCYARVSTTKQKKDLETQCEALLAGYPGSEVIRDIGSGLNFKRKGLQALLGRAIQGDRLTVVVTYRDRLARFGFDLIEWIVSRSGGQVLVLNQINTSPVQELVHDLTAIITVFSSRLHGLRSHKNKKALVASYAGATADAKAVGGQLPLGLQPDGGPVGAGL